MRVLEDDDDQTAPIASFRCLVIEYLVETGTCRVFTASAGAWNMHASILLHCTSDSSAPRRSSTGAAAANHAANMSCGRCTMFLAAVEAVASAVNTASNSALRSLGTALATARSTCTANRYLSLIHI